MLCDVQCQVHVNKIFIVTLCGCERMVIGFSTTYVANHTNYVLVRIYIRVRCTTLCNKVCQWIETGRWFSSGPPVSSTTKTARHDIAEIFLKVALNTIKQTNKQPNIVSLYNVPYIRNRRFLLVMSTLTIYLCVFKLFNRFFIVIVFREVANSSQWNFI